MKFFLKAELKYSDFCEEKEKMKILSKIFLVKINYVGNISQTFNN